MKIRAGRLFRLIAVVAGLSGLCACDSVDDDRIPVYQVRIALDNTGLWDTYGVHAYGDSRVFVRPSVPADFPYTVSTYTGFGGVLLVMGGSDAVTVLAYDLACPVERQSSVRVAIDRESGGEAVCPSCGSRFNVIEYNGSPVSGKAYLSHYALRRYRAIPSLNGGYTITN